MAVVPAPPWCTTARQAGKVAAWFTAPTTNTRRGQLPNVELRHRRRARCEDCIRTATDTGLTNLPLHGFDANRVWCEIVCLACELTVWMQMLTLADHPARRWEPKRLRLRLFARSPNCAGRADHGDRVGGRFASDVRVVLTPPSTGLRALKLRATT
jgi:hypothetical protein